MVMPIGRVCLTYYSVLFRVISKVRVVGEEADEEYRQEIIAPLQEIFEKGEKEYVIALLRYYTRLLLRWANPFGKSFLVGSTPSPLYPPPPNCISITIVFSSGQK